MEGKLYYTIKEISEFTGENASTLRFWENEFKELSPKRTASGRRQYTEKDIDTISIIQYLLRTKGMHLAAAKEQLRTNRQNISFRMKALEKLEDVRERLELLRQALNKI
ncbi:MAG: MerR family transcriptional regulator [Muribaculaceae bacterium]|nr:MerR family transcriptional regulator [Muribaculaceae bacterium]